MKKFITLLALLLPIVSGAKDKIVPYEKLPTIAKIFIEQNFNNLKPLQVTYEWNEYEVLFNDLTTIEFNAKGLCKEIKRKNEKIPANLIPGEIKNLVEKNFPNNYIVAIKYGRIITEVKLNNKLELKFDNKGNLLALDD